MDRITRALDLAKQGVDSPAAAIESPLVDKEKKVELKKSHDYKNTRTIHLSKEDLRENRIIVGVDSDQAAVDKYGVLRTRVLHIMRQNNWKTLGITSADPSVGKTITAINLAISIAMDHNQSVLLVDADMRKPGISQKLGFSQDLGLNDYLVSDTTLEEVLVHPDIENLVLVPTGGVETGTAELLSSPRMIQFVQQASKRYPDRLVLFDLPPVLVGDDVLALAPHMDAFLLVVEDGKTQSNKLMQVSELLKDINLAGVVLNKSKEAYKESYQYY